MTHYHKLVRDKIPQIIEGAGKTCTCSILSEQEYDELRDSGFQVICRDENRTIEQTVSLAEKSIRPDLNSPGDTGFQR